MSNTFLVVGLGIFGSYVSKTLCHGGASVLAVDREEGVVNTIRDRVSRAICCDATHADAMEAAGAFNVGTAIVALRQFDATVLVTLALRQHRVPHILVRVDNAQQAKAIQGVGATEVLFPSRDTALRIANRLIHPAPVEGQSVPSFAHLAHHEEERNTLSHVHDVF
ncbi:MAG: TrkA family potassium uptake protein [Magnetococcales bacterium]|nr:TrkA family potassium uptake protein [Magnetococcales bacterium]